jgi:hypothetical protein
LKKIKKLLDLELTPRSKMTLNIGDTEHLADNHLETSLEEIENWIRSL